MFKSFTYCSASIVWDIVVSMLQLYRLLISLRLKAYEAVEQMCLDVSGITSYVTYVTET